MVTVAATSAGPVLVSPSVGLADATWGAAAIPTALLAVVVLDTAVVAALAASTRRRTTAGAPAAGP